jgi:hypothetical protein
MKFPLFELEKPENRVADFIFTKAEKRVKPLSLEKYVILCQKEEIINFLVDHIPFSSVPKRINSGYDQGGYTVKVKMDQIQADYSTEPYHGDYNKKIFQNEIDNIIKYWFSGKIYAHFYNYTEYIQNAQILFFFDKKHTKTYESEWKEAFQII